MPLCGRKCGASPRDAAALRRRMHPPFFLKDQKECAVHGGRKNLGGAYGVKLQCPAKAGVEFAGDMEGVGSLSRAARAWWMLWAAATNGRPKTKRLLSPPCCRRVAVEGAIVSEDMLQVGRAAMGAVLGAGAAGRTLRSRAHRPSGRERRPRKLHIPRSGASAAAHSFRCSSFSHANRCAYVRAGAQRDHWLSRPKTQMKNISFPPAAATFLWDKEKWGRQIPAAFAAKSMRL